LLVQPTLPLIPTQRDRCDPDLHLVLSLKKEFEGHANGKDTYRKIVPLSTLCGSKSVDDPRKGLQSSIVTNLTS
jgi:hypothetical protein